MQRAVNSQENLKEQIWRTYTPDIKTSYKTERIRVFTDTRKINQ